MEKHRRTIELDGKGAKVMELLRMSRSLAPGPLAAVIQLFPGRSSPCCKARGVLMSESREWRIFQCSSCPKFWGEPNQRPAA